MRLLRISLKHLRALDRGCSGLLEALVKSIGDGIEPSLKAIHNELSDRWFIEVCGRTTIPFETQEDDAIEAVAALFLIDRIQEIRRHEPAFLKGDDDLGTASFGLLFSKNHPCKPS